MINPSVDIFQDRIQFRNLIFGLLVGMSIFVMAIIAASTVFSPLNAPFAHIVEMRAISILLSSLTAAVISMGIGFAIMSL